MFRAYEYKYACVCVCVPRYIITSVRYNVQKSILYVHPPTFCCPLQSYAPLSHLLRTNMFLTFSPIRETAPRIIHTPIHYSRSPPSWTGWFVSSLHFPGTTKREAEGISQARREERGELNFQWTRERNDKSADAEEGGSGDEAQMQARNEGRMAGCSFLILCWCSSWKKGTAKEKRNIAG